MYDEQHNCISFEIHKATVILDVIECGGRHNLNIFLVTTNQNDDTAVYTDKGAAYIDALTRIIELINPNANRYGVRFKLQVERTRNTDIDDTPDCCAY